MAVTAYNHWLNEEKTLQLVTRAVSQGGVEFIFRRWCDEHDGVDSTEMVTGSGHHRWMTEVARFAVDDDTAIRIARDLLRDASLNKYGSG